MPALMGAVPAGGAATVLGLGIIPEHSLLDSCTRLSISLEESVFKVILYSFKTLFVHPPTPSPRTIFRDEIVRPGLRGSGDGRCVGQKAIVKAQSKHVPSILSKKFNDFSSFFTFS